MSILKDDPPQQPTDIVLFPPDDLGNVSDEDSANKDDGIKNVNQLDKRLLSQKVNWYFITMKLNWTKMMSTEIKRLKESLELQQIHNQDHPAPILCVQTQEKEKMDAQHKNVELGLIWGDHKPLTKMLFKTSLLNKNLRSPLL